MTQPHLRQLLVALALAGALAGCGDATTRGATGAPSRPDPECAEFFLSLVSGSGGQASPLAAAHRYLTHTGLSGFRDDGWSTRRGRHTATLRQHDLVLRTVEGPDHSWQVISGRSCPPDPQAMPHQDPPAG